MGEKIRNILRLREVHGENRYLGGKTATASASSGQTKTSGWESMRADGKRDFKRGARKGTGAYERNRKRQTGAVYDRLDYDKHHRWIVQETEE